MKHFWKVKEENYQISNHELMKHVIVIIKKKNEMIESDNDEHYDVMRKMNMTLFM